MPQFIFEQEDCMNQVEASLPFVPAAMVIYMHVQVGPQHHHGKQYCCKFHCAQLQMSSCSEQLAHSKPDGDYLPLAKVEIMLEVTMVHQSWGLHSMPHALAFTYA